MASGSFISNTGSNLEIGAEWTSVPDTAGNCSTVRVNVFLTHYSLYCAALSGSYIKIGDSVYNFSKSMSVSQNVFAKTYIAAYETTVHHLSDGTKNVTVSVGWNFSGVYNGMSIGMLEVSKSITLDAIPRASSLTVPSTVNIGSKITADITSHLSTHTHRLCFNVGEEEYCTDFLTKTNPEITVPSALAKGMTSSNMLAGSVTLHTYNSEGTWIGGKTLEVTYMVPETAEFMPELTMAVVPVSKYSLIDKSGLYASGISKAKVTVTGVSAKFGASVSSSEISVGASKSSGYSFTSGVLSAGNLTVSAKVTDSRGISVTKTVTVNVKPYCLPYSARVSVYRCDENGTADDSGSHIYVYASGKCAQLDGSNTCSLQLSYKAHSSESYTDKINLLSDNAIIIPAGLTAENSYDVKITCTDTVGGSTDHIVVIPTARADLHIKNGSVRFGGFCEKQGFDCDWDANFAGSVSIGEVPITDFVIDSGKNGVFRWRKWNSGFSECYGNTENKSYNTTESFGALYRSAEPQNPLHYPYGLFKDPPFVQAFLRQGSLVGVSVAQGDLGSESISPSLYLVSPVSGTVTASIDLYCIGRWK